MARPKGSAGKKTLEVAEKLKKLKCDPITGMAKIAKIAMDEGDLELAGKMYEKLAKYYAPQLKAIEHSGIDGGAIDLDHKFEIVFIDPEQIKKN